MRILGIDPGVATIGYGCIETRALKPALVDYGVIQTLPESSFSVRLQEIGKDFMTLLSQFSPEVVVVEELFFNKNVKTGIQVAQVRGVILYLSMEKNVQLFSLNPLEIKSILTGDGKADKKQVQKMVQYELKLPSLPTPDDAADALAAALSFAFCPKFVHGKA